MNKLCAFFILLFLFFSLEFYCFTQVPGYLQQRIGFKSAIPGSSIYLYYKHNFINGGKVEVDPSVLKNFNSLS